MIKIRCALLRHVNGNCRTFVRCVKCVAYSIRSPTDTGLCSTADAPAAVAAPPPVVIPPTDADSRARSNVLDAPAETSEVLAQQGVAVATA